MFTVKDVYILGAALVGDKENDDKDEKDFAPVHMTILLQEALDAENSIRAFDGEAELAAAPVLGIDDTIPYHDSIVRGAFPYGLAWQYHQDAGNNQLAAMYRNMFIDAVERSYKYNMRKH